MPNKKPEAKEISLQKKLLGIAVMLGVWCFALYNFQFATKILGDWHSFMLKLTGAGVIVFSSIGGWESYHVKKNIEKLYKDRFPDKSDL